jgi:hypothetical protein
MPEFHFNRNMSIIMKALFRGVFQNQFRKLKIVVPNTRACIQAVGLYMKDILTNVTSKVVPTKKATTSRVPYAKISAYLQQY